MNYRMSHKSYQIFSTKKIIIRLDKTYSLSRKFNLIKTEPQQMVVPFAALLRAAEFCQLIKELR